MEKFIECLNEENMYILKSDINTLTFSKRDKEFRIENNEQCWIGEWNDHFDKIQLNYKLYIDGKGNSRSINEIKHTSVVCIPGPHEISRHKRAKFMWIFNRDIFHNNNITIYYS